jgi:hypothetical protein
MSQFGIAASNISPGEIVGVLRAAKVVKADLPLRAAYSSGDCIITTQRNKLAKDEDCKIDAILMAKTLFDSFPDAGILHVKVLFSEYEVHKYMEVSVSKSDVAAYGDGKLSSNELLSSIGATRYDEDVDPFAPASHQDESAAATSITPGPLSDKRLILLGRIDSLKKHGTNPEMFLTAFQSIEDMVKAQKDPSEIEAAIRKLNGDIDDQEKRREEANKSNMRHEAEKFQANIQAYTIKAMAMHQKLPFSFNDVARVQQLVTAGRYEEAAALMRQLNAKMR